MRAHAVLGMGLVLALAASCGQYTSGSRATPQVAAADSVPAAMTSRARRPARVNKAAPGARKADGPWKRAKGIGASGGPAGREDLRPDMLP